MFGKHHDCRVYTHLTRMYSRVPYLDQEITNLTHQALRQSRRNNKRTSTAKEGLDRTLLKSQELQNYINQSRALKNQAVQDFKIEMEKSQEKSLLEEKEVWANFEKDQQQNRISYVKDQLYLESLLKSNSTKADSRLTFIRKWN